MESANVAENTRKRARYTSVACHECKRRKIRCNGEKPCERCGNQGLTCVYPSHDFQDSEEYRQMRSQINALEDRVKELFELVDQLQHPPQARPTPQAPPVAANKQDMDVDMSRNGHILWVQSPDPAVEPTGELLLGLEHRDLMHLISIYEIQIHVLYPMVDMIGIQDSLQNLLALHKPAVTTNQSNTISNRRGDDLDATSTVLKMVLAIGAYVDGSELSRQKADEIHEDVKSTIEARGELPGFSSRSAATLAALQGAKLAIINGLRLRLLWSLWYFQHGEVDAALLSCIEAEQVFEQLSAKHAGSASPDEALLYLKLGAVVYSMYWRWIMLARSPPRRGESSMDATPPRRLDDEYDMADPHLRGPMMHYGKLCSLITFAFEEQGDRRSLLETVQPPYSDDRAIDFVNRWQGSFPDGLRSIALLRPESLANMAPREKIVTTAIHLHGNSLRLEICRYKTTGTGDRYKGPLNELFTSSKYAQQMLNVLWAIHELKTVWHVHLVLYNHFLVQAGDWLYGLLSTGTISPSHEVSMALERTVVMLETHAGEFPRAEKLLRRMQETQ